MKASSFRKGVFFSLVFNVVSKGLVFLVNFFIAFYFGANDSTDIYFFCLTSILLVVTFISNMNTTVIVPQAMLLEESEGVNSFYGLVNRYFLLLFFTLSLLAVTLLFNPVLILSAISGFSTITLKEHSSLIQLAIPVLILQSISTVLNDLLASRRYFVIPMIVSAINSLVIILMVVLTHEEFGLHGIFFANIAAFSVSILVQAYLLIKVIHWNPYTVGTRFSKRLWKNLSFANLANLATVFSSFLPLYLLSGYGNGYLTSLSLGQRLAEVPNSMISLQLAAVIGIKLNELSTKNELAEINRTFLQSSRLLVFVLIPISLITFVLSEDFLKIIFGQGNLDSKSLVNTSYFLRGLILASPFLGLNILVSRVYIARQKIKEAFYYQIILNLILGFLIFLGIHFLGPMGYCYGYLFYWVLNVFVLYYHNRRLFSFLEYGKILYYILVVYIINLPLFGVLIKLSYEIQLPSIPKILLITFTHCIIVLIVNYFFRINHDIYQISQKLFKSFRGLINGF
jgi:putative peptidoglycan lipid II flippase